MIFVVLVLLVIVLFSILGSIRQVNEYQRGVLFTFGRFTRIINPGLTVVLPVMQSMSKVDIRTKAVDVPQQDAITRDNVSVKVTAVVYYKVADAAKAILEVQNYAYAVNQLALTTMRNIVGEVTLDELLSNRAKISESLEQMLDRSTGIWGVKVENVEIKDIELPEEMKRVMARVAEAEREKEAVIRKSEGEKQAAVNLAEAAGRLSAVPGALHLRTLETINDVSADQSNTIFFAMPLEILKGIEGFSKKYNGEN
ncbi:MAG: slipin family protein [Eubacteriaceae bacterium]|nr:slipin family protein [Eubacteriaceae bacterium]